MTKPKTLDQLRAEKERVETQLAYSFDIALQNEFSPEENIALTVVECSEFHNMGEFHENIKSLAEAIAIFKEIPLERMHGIPAIGIRVADPNNLDDGVEMDVLIGKRIDLDMLHYVPGIADNWQAQQMIR